jgi:hypothetical protein
VYAADLVRPDAPTEKARAGYFGGGDVDHTTKLIGTLRVCRLVEWYFTFR